MTKINENEDKIHIENEISDKPTIAFDIKTRKPIMWVPENIIFESIASWRSIPWDGKIVGEINEND